MGFIVKASNILFLFTSSIVFGFIFYIVFDAMSWWNPLYIGFGGGAFHFLLLLPTVVRKIKEQGGSQ